TLHRNAEVHDEVRLHVVVRQAATGGADRLERHRCQTGRTGDIRVRRRRIRQRHQWARGEDVTRVEVSLKCVRVNGHLALEQRHKLDAGLFSDETPTQPVASVTLPKWPRTV